MKRFQTEYSENSITYWPTYKAGKIGRIFCVVLSVVYITTSIWIVFGNSTRATRLGVLLVSPFVIAAFHYAFSFISRTMYVKIVVSIEGIMHFKNKTTIEKQIKWEEVSSVYFCQDPWYGRKSCRIYSNEMQSPKLDKKHTCDYILPVHSVDEQKLLRLIPSYLWKNKPHWI